MSILPPEWEGKIVFVEHMAAFVSALRVCLHRQSYRADQVALCWSCRYIDIYLCVFC